MPGSTSSGSPRDREHDDSASACAWPPFRKPCGAGVEDQMIAAASRETK